MPLRVSLLLLLVVLLALVGIVWVMAAGGDGGGPGVGDPFERSSTETDEAPLPLIEETAPALAGSKRAREPRRRRPRWPVIPSDQIPRGALVVLPVDENDVPVDARTVSVRLEREGAEFSAPPLGRPDYETGTWTFEKVTIGRVRVIVFGDHLLETVARAEIETNATAEVKVAVKPAGALRYKARLYSGEAPEQVTLSLLAPRTRRPQAVYWQMRLPTAHNAARKTTSVTQGPEGIVFAIPPGSWTLRAESPEGEIDLVDVEVRPGETQDVEILLRR